MRHGNKLGHFASESEWKTRVETLATIFHWIEVPKLQKVVVKFLPPKDEQRADHFKKIRERAE